MDLKPAGKEFGTEPYKLVRNADPSTSIDAARSINTTKLEKLVYDAISTFDSHGCIAHDIEDMFSERAPESIHARFSGLFQKGLIEYTGEKRKGKHTRMQRVARISTGQMIPIVLPKKRKQKIDIEIIRTAFTHLEMSEMTWHVERAYNLLKSFLKEDS